MSAEKSDDPERCGGGAGCPRSACLQLFVDGELEPTPASDVEAHIAGCAPCAERASLLVAMKSSLRRTCIGHTPDTLRAKICLAVARESTAGRGTESESVEAFAGGHVGEGQFGEGQFGEGQFGEGQFGEGQFGEGQFGDTAAAPSRESLLADRFAADRVADRALRSTRVAYGVGAIALAAGVALAVVGERVNASTAGLQPGGDDPRRTEQKDDGAQRRSATQDGERALLRPLLRPLLGDAAGVGVPGGLLPVPQRGATVTGPALAPSGRNLEDRPTLDTVLDDLVVEHMNPLPPEETNPEKLRRFESVVGVAMRAPTLRKYDGRFRGARLLPMRGAQRTAMLQYDLPDGERVTVYLWNPQAVPIGATRLHPRILHDSDARLPGDSPRPPSSVHDPDRAPIFVGEARGYSVAACERRGVGYALATKRDADESVRMVAASVP